MTTGGGYGFRLDAERVEPSGDPAWLAASRPLKAQFWAEAGRFAARTWDASRAKGLDRHGRPLAPISPMTRAARRDDINPFTGKPPYSPMGRARASAPPLTPVGPKSRTRSLLRWRPEPGKGVWFTWIYDRNTRHYWGEILARHGRGFVQRFRSGFRFVPPRDVLGFSEAELAAIRDHMARWWAARQPRAVDRPRERITAEPFRRRDPFPIPIDPTRPRRRPGSREVIRPEVISGQYGIGTDDGGGFTESSGWFRRTTGWTPPPSWTKPPAPRRPPPAAAAMPVPALRRDRGAIIPSVPTGAAVRRAERLMGRRLDREMMGRLAVMAMQAATPTDAERRARQEGTPEGKALWRALAILLRAGVRFATDRRAG